MTFLRFVLGFVVCCAFLTGCPDTKEPTAKDEGKSEVLAFQEKDEKPKDEKPLMSLDKAGLDQWGVTQVEKAWGLKFKSVSFGQTIYTLVVEFTKDLTDEELKEVQAAFPFNQQQTPTKVTVYFFDKDNVVLQKGNNWKAVTELTGVKGDAFRLTIEGPQAPGGQFVVRAELRLPKDDRTRDKDKDKDKGDRRFRDKDKDKE